MYTAALLVGALSLATTAIATEDIPSYTQTFINANGQIRTPGHVIVNAPQPWTPLGGGMSSLLMAHCPGGNTTAWKRRTDMTLIYSLHISLDVSANGKIPLPPYKDDAQDRIDEVSIFLTSNIVGMNITITNALYVRSINTNQTELEEYGHKGINGEFDERVVMWQEPGSTVKHVDYKWPKCFVNGEQGQEGEWSYRGYQPVGAYNISIHQLGKIAGKNYYSVFNLPIIVMDDIKLFNTPSGGRTACEYVSNWWVDGKQGENMSLDEYPWKSDSDERLEVKSESGKGGKVEEYVKWPREENEEERQSRVARDEAVGKAEASMSLAASYAAKATSTSKASGAKQSAQVVLGVAAAGLALVL